MSERKRVVHEERSNSARVPDWASAGVVLIEWLRGEGLWGQLTERLKIQREGGYPGIDAFVFLIYLFTSGLRLGVKEFGERARKCHGQLAAVGERARLPTQASMSRILAAVSPEMLKEFGPWLLREAAGTRAVLNHPSVLTRDAEGAGWHVFDWDPTITTLRHRALPVFENMPQANRRSESLAAPGYPGRKRGDVQFSRGTLQHAGSGLWLGIEMGPGNGAHRHAVSSAIEQVVATCEGAGLPKEKALLRMDGAAGNVPAITGCIKAALHFVTRLAHYHLLENDAVKRHLNEAQWYVVPSSGSGPTRQAADLGRVTLEAAPTSVQADGGAFAPVEVRVVVSRFLAAGEGRGAGHVIDGWQYELYGTNLTAAAWPEVEVVAGYYGRCGQENRFSQEDSELGLDRIFSYHLPGQHLANLIGLFVWNFSICRGMDLECPPRELPAQTVATRTPVEQTPRLPEVEAAAPLVETAIGPSTPVPAIDASSSVDPNLDVAPMMNALDWSAMLLRYDGWRWLTESQSLLCPAAHVLPLAQIEHVKGQPIRARFVANSGTCDSCELRPSCITSVDPLYKKDVRLCIPPPLAAPLREMWLRAREQKPSKPELHAKPQKTPRHTARMKPLVWFPLPTAAEQTPLVVAPPILLPATLRKQNRATCSSLEIEIIVAFGPPVDRPSPVLATSPTQRQRRRLTWPERLRFNELRSGSTVELRLYGLHAAAVRRLLPDAPSTANAA